jgi:acyl-CoA thioester hydrolase
MEMELWTGKVEPTWIDYNGHMNVAYYHMAFDQATDRFLDRIGLGEGYLAREPGSMFALEDRLTYQREVELGDPLRVTLQLLDHDDKRMHYFQRMYHAEKGYLAATCEHLSIFIDMQIRRSALLPAPVQTAIGDIFETHRHLDAPVETERAIGIRRRES